MIGGLGNRMSVWDDLLPKLTAHHRVIRFDPAGLGCSSAHQPAGTVADLARHAATLLDHLNIRRCQVAGISLGGFVAQSMALQFPERVDKLVLMGSSIGGKAHVVPDQEVLQFFATSATLPREAAVRKGYVLALRPDFEADHPKRHGELVAREAAYQPPPTTVQKHAMAGFFFDQSAVVQNIAVPTLVLHGALDRVVPVANGRKLGEAIPNAKTVVLPKAGHLCIIDSVEATAAAILAFTAPTF
nr:alpha/beta fold hydrolase [Acanthopleuribacter pedis]